MTKPVIIHEYNPRWPVDFEDISAHLYATLAGMRVAVEHIGSTAVPSLASKDILDIVIVYEGDAEFQHVKTALRGIGLDHVGDQGIPEREVFKAHEAGPTLPNGRPWPRVHLYACRSGCTALSRMLTFRDLLKANPGLRERYAELKKQLADSYGSDREGYTNAKSRFIESALSTTDGNQE
jgi:GrpB-like predicted nucleotidyltransferase (UPF0157 family)